MNNLAIFGGKKTIQKPFERINTIGKEELAAVTKVVKSGNLSQFFGSWNNRFFGGENVTAFEKEWALAFGVKYAISFNSLTSGLVAALGAVGLEPGDEVIVSPWTMSASATAILVWNAIPVFADIKEDTYTLDPVSIEKCITPRTKAILVPDIFGQSADLNSIMKLVKKHGIFVIEDAAQSPFSKYGKKKTGTVGHIGGFSLNYHKHIHTGEGGMMVTNNKLLAERMQLIRNHAESVVGPKQEKNLSNMIGFNFRLGEMEAAIGREQLKKLPRLSAEKTLAGTTITNELKKLQGFIPPEIEKGSTHVFYIYGFRIDKNKIGVDREKIVEALKAEGVPWIYGGYQNIHLLPMYQKKIAYGKNGFPWNPFNKKISYKKGICPTAERLHDKELVCLQICQHNYTKKEIDLVIKAFKKVWNNLDKLK